MEKKVTKKEKLKESIEESLYQYPYQNLSPIDMVDEIWKPFPGKEEYYMVSNKGRVKSLARTISFFDARNGMINYIKNGRILKQVIYKSFNEIKRTYHYSLIFSTKVETIPKHHVTSRVVYETFVAPIPEKMYVIHKNNDPFDNTVENLYLLNFKEFGDKMYEENKEFLNKECGLFIEKIISQYDLDGNYIQTFKSIIHAAQTVGIEKTPISSVLSGEQLTAGGYYWKEGNSKDRMDTSFIEKRKKQATEGIKERNGKKVVQYSLDGKYMATYQSLQEAFEQTGIPKGTIRWFLYGKRYFDIEFIWKYAGSFDTIPDEISVEEYILPGSAVNPKSRKELNLPEYEYPYQDLYVCDLENEKWKSIPGFAEKYCMVSNMGRVKVLDRLNQRQKIRKERIIKQVLNKNFDEYTDQMNQSLFFSFIIGKKTYRMSVEKAVYSAFIELPEDSGKNPAFIYHRDSDLFNNRLDNLFLATEEDIKKRITEKEKLKESVEKPLYQYPYQNLSLIDMVDEIWKPLPGREEYYMVSNKGRVKSLFRIASRLHRKGHMAYHIKEERIVKQVVNKRLNQTTQTYSYYLNFESIYKKYMTSRAVYEAFVALIPNETVVLHINDDPFDNTVENLYLLNRKEYGRKMYEKSMKSNNRVDNLFLDKI